MARASGSLSWLSSASFSNSYSVGFLTLNRSWDIGRLFLLRVRYYLIMIGLCLFFVYVTLGFLTLDKASWGILVVLRYALIAAADTLGEGLMVMMRKLEENAKEFFDEVDTINIVGTYIACRGFSRAICSTLGAYAATSIDPKAAFLIVSIAPLAIAVFAKETFHEMRYEESELMEASPERSNKQLQDGLGDQIQVSVKNFGQIISVNVVIIHFCLLLLVSLLPVGDLAHQTMLLKRLQNRQKELILLVYIYHSLVTYGILFYVVSRSSRMSKKFLTMAGLACLLIGTLAPLLMSSDESDIKPSMLILLSTLFHLFSHLGHSLLLVTFYSIFLPFPSKPFALPAMISGSVKAATMLQHFLDKVLSHHVYRSLSQQVFVYWCIVSVALVMYGLGVEANIDRQVEEALILTRYYEIKRNPSSTDVEDEEDDRKIFRPSSGKPQRRIIEDEEMESHIAPPGKDNSKMHSSNDDSSLDAIRHF